MNSETSYEPHDQIQDTGTGSGRHQRHVGRAGVPRVVWLGPCGPGYSTPWHARTSTRPRLLLLLRVRVLNLVSESWILDSGIWNPGPDTRNLES